ncbi:MAG TPA: SAM-dependent chlorinase/fluorinase, partial [Woeseiaceae bacterium]|nr:SAM-dependent chlorinase/fluorinase [Woeseiaceae bacterium]
PDNGLLAPLLDGAGDCIVYTLDPACAACRALPAPSPTFHGRDVFAPLAAEIAAGRLQPRDTGRPTTAWTPGWIDDPVIGNGRVSGVIVTVDAFGNLISNIEGGMLQGIDRPLVRLAGRNFELHTTYGRTEPGSYLALINSFGVLEIARAEGNAADGLGSDRGAPVVVSSRPASS